MNFSKDEMKKNVDNAKDTIKESSEDWINYIKDHPIQSVFFALTVYFAFKNMIETAKK